jgi:hypothetical protein
MSAHVRCARVAVRLPLRRAPFVAVVVGRVVAGADVCDHHHHRLAGVMADLAVWSGCNGTVVDRWERVSRSDANADTRMRGWSTDSCTLPIPQQQPMRHACMLTETLAVAVCDVRRAAGHLVAPPAGRRVVRGRIADLRLCVGGSGAGFKLMRSACGRSRSPCLSAAPPWTRAPSPRPRPTPSRRRGPGSSTGRTVRGVCGGERRAVGWKGACTRHACGRRLAACCESEGGGAACCMLHAHTRPPPAYLKLSPQHECSTGRLCVGGDGSGVLRCKRGAASMD